MAGGRSRSIDTYELLRGDILAGRMRPGQRLPFAELCQRYDTSVGAVREGLMRLSEQGLVRGEPQQGFSVTSISVADLQDLTDARCELEGLTLARAVSEGDVNWESRVVATHHVLDRTPYADSEDPARLSEQWLLVHATFHETLLEGCANGRLRAIASNLRDSAGLYQRWSWAVDKPPRRNIAKEHRGIVQAVIGRDPEKAKERLRDHIASTTKALLRDVSGEDDLHDRIYTSESA